MKANELEIGDLVYNHRNWECPIVEIHKNSAVVIARHYGEEEFLLSDLRPIPLTPEILEKNGFVKGYMFNNVWNYIEDYKRLVIVYTGEVFNIQDTLIDFKHVHKLQHILKICGIEKEIIL